MPMKWTPRVFIYLLCSMHLAGVIGLLTPWKALFQWFTPLHILATTAMLIFPQIKERAYQMAVIGVAVATFFVEMAGVQTGLIFGDYAYGATLGPKVGGTPLLIGVNWVLLSFSIAHLLSSLTLPLVVRATLGATLMLGMDVLIEPVAMHFDFWDWAGGVIPTQNYLGWWCVSFAVFMVLLDQVRFQANPLAGWVWGAQLVFFLLLNSFLLAGWG